MSHWTMLYAEPAPTGRINDIGFRGDEIWTVSSSGFVRRWVNGQVQADQLRFDGNIPHLRCLAISPDGNRAWAGIYLRMGSPVVPRLIEWTAASQRWSAVPDLPLDPVDGLCGLRFAGETTVFALGTYDEATVPALWRCRLGVQPERWQEIRIADQFRKPKITQLIDLHFWNEAEGLAVGGAEARKGEYEPAILSTVDGGDTWRPLKLPDLGPTGQTRKPMGRYAWKIQFVDERLGFVSIASYGGASNPSGFVLKTVDRGRTWTPIAIPRNVVISANLHGVGFVDDRLGWTCGHEKPLVQTSDGGLVWQPVTTPGIADINRFATWAGQTYAAGNGLYRWDRVL